MTTDATRRELLKLLDGSGSHMTFEDAVADFPDDAINAAPPNVAYSPWHLVEHLRITQRDMLDYVTRADYPHLEWPTDYWPAHDARASRDQWTASVQAFVEDRDLLGALATDPERDMDTPIPWTRGHSLFRCVRIIGNHNSYHVGELAILRQVTGSWPLGHE